MSDNPTKLYDPVMATLGLLLDEVRLLVEDGIFGQVEVNSEAMTATAALVDQMDIFPTRSEV